MKTMVMALLFTMCWHQAPTTKTPINPETVTVFDKKEATRHIVVTVKEIEMPEEDIKKNATYINTISSDHLYQYTYLSVSSSGKKVLYKHNRGTFGAMDPKHPGRFSSGMEIKDVIQKGKWLDILCLWSNQPWVMICNIDKMRTTKDGQFDYMIPLERNEAITAARFIGYGKNVTVELTHNYKMTDETPIVTRYHLAAEGDGCPVFIPDAMNVSILEIKPDGRDLTHNQRHVKKQAPESERQK